MTPRITIRMGATADEVEVDGKVFDRSRMTGAQKGTLRRMIVEALRRTLPSKRRAAHA